jgi:hypothetical protein
VLDSIGRNRNHHCNLGRTWSQEEIQLLLECQLDLSRPQAARKYLEEATKRGYPSRTLTGVLGRLNKHFRDNKTKHQWSRDEENHLSELFQEYPFLIALEKYNHWAATRGYSRRNPDPVRVRLSKLGVSVKNPVFVCTQGAIARSLGISDLTAKKYIERSRVKVEPLGQKLVCDAENFYTQFARKGLWLDCMRGLARNGSKPDLDRWALLLPIQTSRLTEEWAAIESKIPLVRSPLSFQPLTVSQFARETGVTTGAIRTAIREGRRSVGKVRFELCDRVV